MNDGQRFYLVTKRISSQRRRHSDRRKIRMLGLSIKGQKTAWKVFHLPPTDPNDPRIRGNVKDRTDAQNKLVATANDLGDNSLSHAISKSKEWPTFPFHDESKGTLQRNMWRERGLHPENRKLWGQSTFIFICLSIRWNTPANRNMNSETRATSVFWWSMKKQNPAASNVHAMFGNVNNRRFLRPNVSIVYKATD